MLAGCGDGPGEREDRAARPSATADSLDALAMESGALPDQSAENPVGRYGRRYEGGADRLCIIPDSEESERYRFGAEMRIGGDEYCRGAGEARIDGDTLSLRFEGIGEGCTIEARYDGDRLVLPGQLGMAHIARSRVATIELTISQPSPGGPRTEGHVGHGPRMA